MVFVLPTRTDGSVRVRDPECFPLFTDGSTRLVLSTNQGLLSTYNLMDFEQTWLKKIDDTITSIVFSSSSDDALIVLTDKGELQCVTEIPAKKKISDGPAEDMESEEAFNPDEEILAGTGVERKRKTPTSDDEDDDGIGENFILQYLRQHSNQNAVFREPLKLTLQ